MALPPPAGPAAENPPASAGAGNLMACLLVGGVLGWGVDALADIFPWGMLVGVVLGFAAWLRAVWQQAKQPHHQPAGEIPRESETKPPV